MMKTRVRLYDDEVLKFIDWKGFKIVAGNEPLARPGVYLFRHTRSNRHYVGISGSARGVLARCNAHRRGDRPRKLEDALKRYGHSEFIIFPILYVVGAVDRGWLQKLESTLIQEYNSVEDGYNTQASSGSVGPYGEAFSDVMREALSDPEWRTKHSNTIRAVWADLDLRNKQSETTTKSWRDPVVSERRIAGMKAAAKRLDVKKNYRRAMDTLRSDPVYVKRNIDALERVRLNPISRANYYTAMASSEWGDSQRAGCKRSWVDRPRIWISNGVDIKGIQEGDQIPDGWKRGRGEAIKSRISIGVSAYFLEKKQKCANNG